MVDRSGSWRELPVATVRLALDSNRAPERLAAAWELGARAIAGPISAAFGIAGPAADGEPVAGIRRVFAIGLAEAGDAAALRVLAVDDPDDRVRAAACQHLARTAKPGDREAYALLERLGSDDRSDEVRLAVVSSLRPDTPAELQARAPQWMRDPSPAVQEAAVERVFEWTAEPRRFLLGLSSQPSELVAHGLRLLRRDAAQVPWQDVGRRIARRELAVLIELALLFEQGPDAPPLDLWLSLARHCDVLHRTSREDVLVQVAAGLEHAAVASSPADLSSEDADLVDEVLRLLARCLPQLAHGSYMELSAAGLVDDPTSAPTAQLTTTFARIWAALARLSPDPGRYPLRPADAGAEAGR